MNNFLGGSSAIVDNKKRRTKKDMLRSYMLDPICILLPWTNDSHFLLYLPNPIILLNLTHIRCIRKENNLLGSVNIKESRMMTRRYA